MGHHTIALLRVMRGSFFVKTPDQPTAHFLHTHMEDLGRRVSDPDDDLKYFKWKRRPGIFMRGQNFNLSSLFRVAIPTNLLTGRKGH